jgi:hypothetical protein
MSSQVRLHIARIAPVALDAFSALFAGCEQAARARLRQPHLDLAALWDFAQYLDLADAGYGKKTDSLYCFVTARVRAHLEAHGASPAVRALCGRTGALADLLADVLDAGAHEERCPEAQAAAA